MLALFDPFDEPRSAHADGAGKLERGQFLNDLLEVVGADVQELGHVVEGHYFRGLVLSGFVGQEMAGVEQCFGGRLRMAEQA